MANYFNVLSPACRLSLSFQKDPYDPITVVRLVLKFTWTMSRLQLLIESTLDNQDSIMTSRKRFLHETVDKEYQKAAKFNTFTKT